MSWRLDELGTWCGGTLSGAGDTELRGVSTDTRTLEPGQLFVAISGETYDGHDYLQQATERGAAAVLVSRNGLPIGVPSLRVPDTVRALGELARGYRESFAGPVLAITGSNGKTTTKELVAEILAAAKLRVRRSPGNLNNQIGLPLSVLALEPRDQALVVELGMNHAGEIDWLASIAQPDVGAITQVAPAHLGPLGSLDAIARAKGELLEHIRATGTAVLNADDEHVMAQRGRFSGAALLFGWSPRADFRAEPESGGAFRLCTPLGDERVRPAMPGRHMVEDALCAAAVAHASGLLGERGLAALVTGIEAFRGVPGRLALCEAPGGVAVLDDSYNANPHSVIAALEALDALRGERRAVAVLGDMLELGPDAETLHAEVGRRAAQGRVELLIAVGPLSEQTARAAREAGVPNVVHSDDAEQAIAELRALVRAGDLVLVKGSRGMRMERAVHALLEEI